MNQIRQSEFAESHKLNPVEVKALRDKHLTEDVDWHTEGRAIFWSAAAAERVGLILTTPVTAPVQRIETDFGGGAIIPPTVTLTPPGTIEVRILQVARNPKFVYGDLAGARISIAAGKHGKRIVGKKVRVSASTENSETKYTYQP